MTDDKMMLGSAIPATGSGISKPDFSVIDRYLATRVAEIKAERDALAERADALYAELRDVCVGKSGCIACRAHWLVGEAERHVPGCLAAPKTAGANGN